MEPSHNPRQPLDFSLSPTVNAFSFKRMRRVDTGR
jgi:hypothetical protein